MDAKTLALQRIAESGPRPGARFRHYKGGEYEVIANALEEATLRHVVVYRAADGTVWTRPIDDWNETVAMNGVPTKRFTEMES